MSYRKFSADYIFTGYELLGPDSVLIADEGGTIREMVPVDKAGEGVEKFKGIISPGFINAHCHLELSHMKGMIGKGKGMVPFLLTVMNSRSADEDLIFSCIAEAEKEMIDGGIVAVGDICNSLNTIGQKSKRNIYYQNFIEAIGVNESAAETRFNQNLQIFEQFRNLDQPASIVPHAPYSVSKELFRLINSFNSNNLLSMHNQESEAENEFYLYGTGELLDLYSALKINMEDHIASGNSSIKYSLPSFSPEHTLILVHNVVTDKNDLDWIKRNKKILPEIFWCFCPNANKYITGELPDVNSFEHLDDNIIVGTDSLASNDELNILSELKTLQINFPGLSTARLLKWATSNGAKALRIANKLGDFKKDKKPGIVLIENIKEDGSLKNARSRLLL